MKKTGKILEEDYKKLGPYIPMYIKTWEQLEEFKECLLIKIGYCNKNLERNDYEPYGA